MTRWKSISTMMIAALVLGACATSSPGPNTRPGATALPPDDVPGRLPPEMVARGRKLYLLKCAKCHRFYDPASYSDPDWADWMIKMSSKARLNRDEEKVIAAYLGAFRVPAVPTE